MNDWPMYALVWALCGVAALFIARSRGATDAGNWGFIGALLGPIGVVYTLWRAGHIAAPGPGLAYVEDPKAEERFCPTCHTPRAFGARFCSGCGQSLG